MNQPKDSSSLSPEALDALIAKADLSAVVDFFLGSTEASRKPLEKVALKWLRQTRRPWDAAPLPEGWHSLRSKERERVLSESQQARNEMERQNQASRLAIAATSNFSAVAKVAWQEQLGERVDWEWTEWRRQLFRLLAGLKPSWLDDWAETLLKRSLDHWFFVRKLVREGLCRKPACDEYTLGLMRALRWRFYGYERDGKGNRKSTLPSIAAALLEDADLLKEDVWRIFELEGTSECNLQALEPVQYSCRRGTELFQKDQATDSWRVALVSLAGDGRLARARLLDASLDALACGFNAHRAVWFSRLHEELKPGVAELSRRRERYLQLLGSPNPNTITFALETLLTLDAEKPLPASEIIRSIEPAFVLKAKATVKSALLWLDRVARREPEHRGAISRLAATALRHESTDVQAAAFKLLDAHGERADQELIARLESSRTSIAPTLRSRLEPWLAGETPPVGKPTVRVVPSAPAKVKAQAPSRLDSSRRLAPIKSFDDLLDRAAYVLANPGSAVEAELVLDGLLRLGAKRPADFEKRVAPLLQQAANVFRNEDLARTTAATQGDYALIRRRMKDTVGGLLALVLMSWARGRSIFCRQPAQLQVEAETLFPVLYQRMSAVADLAVAAVELPLLSAPTHRGGWIEPMELVKRLEAWRVKDHPVEPHDYAIALLRLAPERREPALRAARQLGGETGDALCHALGADAIKIGPTAAFWAAAARARSPFLDDPVVERRHPDLGPDAGLAVRFGWNTIRSQEHFKNPFEKALVEQFKVKLKPKTAFALDSLQISYAPAPPKHTPTTLVAVALHAPLDADGFNYRETAGMLRWALALWPASSEPIFASTAQWLMESTNGFQYRQGYRHPVLQAAFDCLAEPNTWFGPMASLLAVLSLHSPDAECRGLGVDAFVSVVEDGRFSSEILGGTLARLLPTSICKASRLTPSLADIARVSPAHARAVCAVVERALTGDPKSAPKDIARLLELWRDLLVEHGGSVASTEAREFLRGLDPKGRAGKLIKELLTSRAPKDRGGVGREDKAA